METKPFMDMIIGKLTSRKLLVWTVASVLTAMGLITSEDWVAVSLTYIGAEGLSDVATRWKHGN